MSLQLPTDFAEEPFYYLKHYQQESVGQTLTYKDWRLLFLQSFFGAFCFNLLMLLGLRHTTADTAAIITSTIPAFITVFSFFILKESLPIYKLIAIGLSMLGVMLITVTPLIHVNQTDVWGDFFVLLAVITGALFPICAKLSLTKISTYFTSFTFNVFGLLLFLPLAFNQAISFNFHSITLPVWLVVIFYSVAANILYVHFWNKGLTVVSASTASLFTAIMPMSTAIFAYLFLNETITPLQILGMLCIFISLFLGIQRTRIKPAFSLNIQDKGFS